jgi:hypothetical protein
MKYEDALKSLTYENQRKMLEEVDRFLDTLGNP